MTRILGVVTIAMALAVLAFLVPGLERAGTGMADPSLFPMIASALLLLSGGTLVLKGDRGQIAWRKDEGRRTCNALLLVLLAAAYAAVMPWLGFVPATFLLLVCTMLAFGARDWRRVLSIALIVPLAVSYAFAGFFNLHLPPGLWTLP